MNKKIIKIVFLGSLGLLIVRNITHIAIASRGILDQYFFLSLLFIVFLIIQILLIQKNHKLAWAMSCLQIATIYFLSQGTFSWLIAYLAKPFSSFEPFHSHFVSIFLVVTETAKTVLLYKGTDEK